MCCILKLLDVPHVSIFGRNVEITAYNNIIGGCTDGIEVLSKSTEPRQLVLVVIMIKFTTIGDITRADLNSATGSSDDACFFILLNSWSKVLHDVLKTDLGNDGNAIPLALPEMRTLIAECCDCFCREEILLQLRLLHAQHIWLHFMQPRFYARQSSLERVDIPRRDEHAMTVVPATSSSELGAISSLKQPFLQRLF